MKNQNWLRRVISLGQLVLCMAAIVSCALFTPADAPTTSSPTSASIASKTATQVRPSIATEAPSPTASIPPDATDSELGTPVTADSILVPPEGWAIFSSEALGFSVWHLDGGMVIEQDDRAIFLYQEGPILAKRMHLATGETIQDVAEAFVSSMFEGPFSSQLVPPAEPINIPMHEAYSWDLENGLLLARVDNSDVGFVFIGWSPDDPAYQENIYLPFVLQTLGSFRFLGP